MQCPAKMFPGKGNEFGGRVGEARRDLSNTGISGGFQKQLEKGYSTD